MNEELKRHLSALGRQYRAARIVLFGSRARGDHRERSDIDLAVFGLPAGWQGAFCAGIDELPTLLKFDIVFVDAATSPALMAEIERDGVILFEAKTNQTK